MEKRIELKSGAPTRWLPILTAVLLGGSAAIASADSIGASFITQGVGQLVPTSVAGAPPYAQRNWNLPANVASSLVDNNGVATTLSLSSNVEFVGGQRGDALGQDEILMNTYWCSSAANWSIDLTGIPYQNYSIVVYDLQTYAGAAVGVNVGNTTYYTSSPDASAPGYVDGNPFTPFTYTRGTSTDINQPSPLADYVVFSGLSGDAQTINVLGQGFSFSDPVVFSKNNIAAIQIIENAVPEPSTYALIGAGCVLGGFAVRRRVRATN